MPLLAKFSIISFVIISESADEIRLLRGVGAPGFPLADSFSVVKLPTKSGALTFVIRCAHNIPIKILDFVIPAVSLRIHALFYVSSILFRGFCDVYVLCFSSSVGQKLRLLELPRVNLYWFALYKIPYLPSARLKVVQAFYRPFRYYVSCAVVDIVHNIWSLLIIENLVSHWLIIPRGHHLLQWVGRWPRLFQLRVVLLSGIACDIVIVKLKILDRKILLVPIC